MTEVMVITHPISSTPSYVAPQARSGHAPVGEQYLSSSSLSSSSLSPKVTLVKPVDPLEVSSRLENSVATQEQAALSESSVESGEQLGAEQSAEAEKKEKSEKQQLERDQQETRELSTRDREVRAHEQAHMAVGGQYAGAAKYQYERGPDGVSYAVSGEVPIDVSKAATPAETMQKAQVVRRAALAPADPSPQDRSVAAMATQLEAEARQEMVTLRVEEESKKAQASEKTSEETRRQQQGGDTSVKPKSEPSKPNYGANSLSSEHLNSNYPQPVVHSKLQQGLNNASLSSNLPGQLLNQIA